MQLPHVLTRDLVLVGGGHAHALVLRMWGMRPLPGARLTLIDPGPVTTYTGMLPGFVAGHYSRDEIEIDLVRLCRFAGARLIRGAATGIDPARGTVEVEGRGEIGWDVLSIDVGISGGLPVEGFDAHGVSIRPLGDFAARWWAFRDGAARDACVIGGGVGGAELALAMQHGMGTGARVALVEAGGTVAAGSGLSDVLTRRLTEAGIALHMGARAAAVGPDSVTLTDGTRLDSAFTVAATGGRAHRWLAESGLPTDTNGFLRVGPDLRVEGQAAIFAAGDCAHLTHAPRPKAGVFAVRAAPVLRDNLEAALTGGPLRPFRPQRSYLKIVSLGGKAAVAGKWGLRLSDLRLSDSHDGGRALWRWKDRIDRRFMARLSDLPAMTPPPRPRRAATTGGDGDTDVDTGQPLCGGCGSKVSPGALAQALAGLRPVGRDDVLSGPGDDAAVLEIGGRRQVLTTDHLRAFTADHAMLARIAAIHALGDVWAMGAAPQAALVSVVLPVMSPALQARTMAEIMAAARAAMADAGAEIVGGHSSMGAETSIGFTVTGLLDGPALGQAGARPGDALILTRPIGSGTILAGEMQGRARGRAVAALLDAMARHQGDAAAILGGDARAMTDVTGFGLAGHLMAICRASGCGAELRLPDIPYRTEALRLARAGVHSTIRDANRAAAPVAGAAGPEGDLLHDPQTAGGFLAAVPAERAEALLTRLAEAGHPSTRIGGMVAGPPVITCTA